jgi:hypothetical protein
MRSAAELSHVRPRGNGGAWMLPGGARTGGDGSSAKLSAEPRYVLLASQFKKPKKTPEEEPNLRKFLIAGLAAALTIGLAAFAYAQGTESATLTTSVSPTKAGTKSKPKSTDLAFKIENGNTKATLAHLDINLPKTLKLDAKGFPTCDESLLEQGQDDQCPKGSRVGKGTASAILGVANPNGQGQTPLTFKITSYVVSKKKIDFLLKANEIPTLVVVSPGKISKKGHKLTITVPDAAQQPAPGNYAGLQTIDSVLGATVKKHKLVQATGCKHGAHKISTKLTFINNGADQGGTATATDKASCKKK